MPNSLNTDELLNTDKNLSAQKMILSYIEHFCSTGLFFPYRDYEIIETWLEKTNFDPDPILLILSDLTVEGFFLKDKKLSFQFCLRKLGPIVSKRLEVIRAL